VWAIAVFVVFWLFCLRCVYIILCECNWIFCGNYETIVKRSNYQRQIL